MVWPNQLIPAVVISTMHHHEASDPSKTNGWKIGRYAFFLIVASVTFVYEWFPLVIAQFLSYIGLFPTWIAPNNVVVNQVFGGLTGLGLLLLSLDWSIISGFMNASPLMTPGFSLMNFLAGMVIMVVGVSGLSWAGPEFMRYLALEYVDCHPPNCLLFPPAVLPCPYPPSPLPPKLFSLLMVSPC